MLQFKNITLRRGQKILLENASAMINSGDSVGLVGSNGVGKTSLFKLINGSLENDAGICELPNGVRVAEIEQEIPHGQQPAVNYVLSADAALAAVLAQLRQAEQAEDGIAIGLCHQRLIELDGYSAEARAAKILVGLGFQADDIFRPIDDFSGGWRMRLNLAKVLLQPSDLLLLDEPTNHLDLEAIFWLEKWLKSLNKTMLIISHDREFLDNVASRIVFIKDAQLYSYSGNYSRFERQYALQLEQQQAAHEKQQRQITHMMKFVDKFRSKASKAKQAQSRLKMINRIEQVAAVHQANPFSFDFKPAPAAGNPMLTLTKANIGYGGQPILKDVSLSIHPGDRIALIGPNGAGKSTLVKALAKILPVDGESIFNPKLKVGYFTQYQLESLQLTESAIWHMFDLAPNLSERDARQFLGSFNFREERVFEPVRHFSGGEKARLALALLVWQRPNLLLLDEPSNHLDLEMRDALATALQFYEGALILVTHDRYLLNSLADELYLVANGNAEVFKGDLADYQQWFERCYQQKSGEEKTKHKNRPIKQNDKKLASLEKKLAKLIENIATLDEQLTQPELYQMEENSENLNQMVQQREQLTAKQQQLEEEILMLLE